MHFPLPSLFIEDSLHNSLKRHTLELLNDKYKLLQGRSEKYHINQAVELICESIFRNTSNNMLFYQHFVNKNQNYTIMNINHAKNNSWIEYNIEILKHYNNGFKYNNNGWK